MPAQVETLAYVKSRGIPWHGLGTPADGLMTAAELLDKAGLDWLVELRPLFVPGPKGQMVEVPEHFANVRVTDNSVLGVVGNRFTPVQQVESLSCLDAIVDSGEGKYDTAASLMGGKRVFISMVLPSHMEVRGDSSPYDHYVTAINGHDGGQAFAVIRNTIRIVCKNTLDAAKAEGLARYSARHTKGVTEKVGEIREALDLTFKELETFEVLANRLAALKVTEAKGKELLLKVFPPTKTGTAEADLAASHFAAALANWQGSETIDDKLRGTGWRSYNAVAEYADFGLNFRKADNRALCIMTGTGPVGIAKAKALTLLRSAAK